MFLNIKDKVPISDKKCPPHYLPHKLPFGDKITEETCHTHIAWWRRVHHNLFCQILKCPNYKEMRLLSK